MSKSFDEKLADKLSGYSAEVPGHLKGQVIGDAPETFNIYPYFGGILLLLAFFGMGSQQSTLKPTESNQNAIEKHVDQQSMTVISQDNTSQSDELKIDQTYPANHINQSIGLESAITIREQEDESIQYPSSGGFFLDISEDQNNYSPYGLEAFGLATSELKSPNVVMRRRTAKGLRSVIPAKEAKWFQSYFDVGAFFVYNRLKPNLSDEIYVSEYNAPFGVSAERIGFSFGLGLEKEWTRNITSRLGVVFNNYNQHYSFQVRSTTPDSVTMSNTNEYFEPHFHKQAVQIRKRVSAVGLKWQTIWAFPNPHNSLFASFEYNRIVGKGPVFQYENTRHELFVRNQYLIEVGLRKRLFDWNRGHLYVIPGLKYSLNQLGGDGLLSVKPFSAGVSLSYSLK